MKISTAIEERVPGGLCVINDNIRQNKGGEDLHDHNSGKVPRTLQSKAVGLNLKHTECKVMAFNIRGSTGLSATEDSDDCPAVMAHQGEPFYISSRRVAGQYKIDKVSLQIPRIIIDKYRKAEGCQRPAVSTLQIYA